MCNVLLYSLTIASGIKQVMDLLVEFPQSGHRIGLMPATVTPDSIIGYTVL